MMPPPPNTAGATTIRAFIRAIGLVAYSIAFAAVVWLVLVIILVALGPDPPG